jgi:hypothetical protein
MTDNDNQRQPTNTVFAAQRSFSARSRWSRNPRALFFYKRAKRLAGTHGTADEQRKRIADLTMIG